MEFLPESQGEGSDVGSPFLDGIFSAYFCGVHSGLTGHIHLYHDSAAGLEVLLLVGKVIELSVEWKCAASIHRLYQMLPKEVLIPAPEGERLL